MGKISSAKTGLQDRIIKTEPFSWKDFQFIQSEEFKDISAAGYEKLKNSILSNNFSAPFYAWKEEKSGVVYCLDGKHRSRAMLELESQGHVIPETLATTFIQCNSLKEAAKLVLVYSSVYAHVNHDGLLDFMESFEISMDDLNMSIELPEVDMIEIESRINGQGEIEKEIVKQSLKDRFLVPPFSILDTRQHYWQDRKRQWHKLMNSQESREDIELIAKSGQSTGIYELRNSMREKLKREPTWDEIIDYAKKKGMHVYEGASVFDPVLCEVLYYWFCNAGGLILDPFAGGSVRGIVAALSGFPYVGIDLREDQVKANRKQLDQLGQYEDVLWIVGDSDKVLDGDDICGPESADLVLSCPPYHDLEKYSDDPSDLSNMGTDEFFSVYESIIKKACSKLKNNRFACFVVGEIRDKNGAYKNFVGKTVEAFENAGMHYYNEIILINVAGSLAIRAGGTFTKSRKIGKMHQNVLVFYKGDVANAKDHIQEIQIADIFTENNQ